MKHNPDPAQSLAAAIAAAKLEAWQRYPDALDFDAAENPPTIYEVRRHRDELTVHPLAAGYELTQLTRLATEAPTTRRGEVVAVVLETRASMFTSPAAVEMSEHDPERAAQMHNDDAHSTDAYPHRGARLTVYAVGNDVAEAGVIEKQDGTRTKGALAVVRPNPDDDQHATLSVLLAHRRTPPATTRAITREIADLIRDHASSTAEAMMMIATRQLPAEIMDQLDALARRAMTEAGTPPIDETDDDDD